MRLSKSHLAFWSLSTRFMTQLGPAHTTGSSPKKAFHSPSLTVPPMSTHLEDYILFSEAGKTSYVLQLLASPARLEFRRSSGNILFQVQDCSKGIKRMRPDTTTVRKSVICHQGPMRYFKPPAPHLVCLRFNLVFYLDKIA